MPTSGSVTLQEFEEHFKMLASNVNETSHSDVEDFLNDFDNSQPDTTTFPELDVPISRIEIMNVIKKQGKIFSPLLFAFFISDIEKSLQENADAGITLDQLLLYLILFANDAVLFSDTPEGLQLSLDKLQAYCERWNLTVNVDKTKIMVSRKGGILSRCEKWLYNGAEMEIVNQFNYVCIIFTPGGSFIQATKTLSGKALRALCSLLSITKHLDVPLT